MHTPMTQQQRDAYAQTCFALMDPKHRLSMLIDRLVMDLDRHDMRGEKLPRWMQSELKSAGLELHELNKEVRV